VVVEALWLWADEVVALDDAAVTVLVDVET